MFANNLNYSSLCEDLELKPISTHDYRQLSKYMTNTIEEQSSLEFVMSEEEEIVMVIEENMGFITKDSELHYDKDMHNGMLFYFPSAQRAVNKAQAKGQYLCQTLMKITFNTDSRFVLISFELTTLKWFVFDPFLCKTQWMNFPITRWLKEVYFWWNRLQHEPRQIIRGKDLINISLSVSSWEYLLSKQSERNWIRYIPQAWSAPYAAHFGATLEKAMCFHDDFYDAIEETLGIVIDLSNFDEIKMVINRIKQRPYIVDIFWSRINWRDAIKIAKLKCEKLEWINKMCRELGLIMFAD